MTIRIFTIPFNSQTGGFPDEDLRKFLLNKKLESLHPQFFSRAAHISPVHTHEAGKSRAELPKNGKKSKRMETGKNR